MSLEGHMSDKVAVITGSARGIGKAIAHSLASKGYRIVVSDIDEAAGWETAEELGAVHGNKIMYSFADVTSEESAKNLVTSVLERFGALDVLVNNAGIITSKKPFEEYTRAEWQRMFDVNFMGVVNCANAVIPVFKQRRTGSIVNLSSQSALTGGLKAPPTYAAIKAAVLCVTKSLANELGPFGVRVNAVTPGYILTEMIAGKQYDTDTIALRRLGTSEEVADAIAFLAGDDARYVTGVTLDINGGTIMR